MRPFECVYVYVYRCEDVGIRQQGVSCLFVCLSVCLLVCLSVFLCVCLLFVFFCLFVSFFHIYILNRRVSITEYRRGQRAKLLRIVSGGASE